MKISVMLKVMISTLLVFSLALFGVQYMLNQSISDREQSSQIQLEYMDLAHELIDASKYLTNEVRSYVQYGDRVHYDNYWREVNETMTTSKVVDRLEELNTPKELLALVAEARNQSNALIPLEEQAMEAVERGDFEEARMLVFGEEYSERLERIYLPMLQFESGLLEMSETSSNEARVTMMNFFYHLNGYDRITSSHYAYIYHQLV
ncbi:MAG: hypothetical protein LRY71_03920 [Bacillaceae bacterium]|nr:hypothetical protein [Bacillaceae bacterium]